MVENNLASIDDQRLGGKDLILIKLLFTLKHRHVLHFRYLIS